MKKKIKQGGNLGIAIQVQEQIVEVMPHTRFKGMWSFTLNGEKWIASDYAFEKDV